MFDENVIKNDKVFLENSKKDEEETEIDVKKPIPYKTFAGIPLKSTYTPSDIAGINYEDISIPGQYPYTRGYSKSHYQKQSWVMRHGYGYGVGLDTRKRNKFLEDLGGAYHVGEDSTEKPFAFTLLLDLPSQCGYDPDEPEARGRIGECGVSISNMWDLNDLFDNKNIENTETIFITPDASLSFVAQYIAYAETRRIPIENLRLKSCNIFYHQWFWDTAAFPPKYAIRQAPELIKYLNENVPLAELQSITGYNPGEAGASSVMEVAFTLATAVAIVEECKKAGLKPDDILPHFYAHDHLGMDFFETVCKFRAKRRMWAKIFKEKFGCKNPKSLILRNYPQTGGSYLQAQEPENNIIRATLMTLAGVLADVDGIWTASYDEALNIPSEEAVKLAVRTHQILYHETGIPAVTDPLGGSYYVEWLTNRIEEEANTLLGEIDKRGGYIKCWEDGWFRRLIAEEASKTQKAIDREERVVVGVNKYIIDEEIPNAMFRVDPESERKAIEKIKAFRAQRDDKKLEKALSKVEKAAIKIKEEWPESCGVLMPVLIEAFKAQATIGETHRILKEIWGYGYSK